MTHAREYTDRGYLDADGKIIDVPEYIIDKVATEAKRYFTEEQDRLLGVYSEEGKSVIRRISTHEKIDSPGRRELHKKIILQIVGGKKPSSDGIPTVILFAGPPGAGKSTLRSRFEMDVPFTEEHLEQARQIYKEASSACCAIDFGIFKRDLPEYNSANTAYKEKYGDMYAVIRSEASGLNQAIIQFAKEAGLTTIREQLMDIDLRASGELAEAAKGNLIVFGVTCDPDVCRSRVAAREKPMLDEEVCRAVPGFSADGAFPYIATIATNSFLFDTTDRHRTIYAASRGTASYIDEAAFHQFKDYVGYVPAVATAAESRGK